MNLTFFKTLLNRNEIKTIIVTTLIGGGLQIIARRYIKSHPEFLDEKSGLLKEAEPGVKNKNRKPRFRRFLPRGGAIIEVSAISIKITQIVVTFVAKKGLIAGLIVGTGVTLSKIPTSAMSTYLRDAFPQNLPELEKKKFILIDGEKIYLDHCDENIKYLFMVLKDSKIPFEEKKNLTSSIFTKYLNLKTINGRVNFVICIVFILYIFSINNTQSYFLIIEALIKAIKEGRISKVVGRAIIRKLKKRGLPVDPTLIEVINS